MKSKFAKFTDGTIGAALVFVAATAVFLYYTTAQLAVFCATAVTACAMLLSRLGNKRRESAESLSAAADGMFFDFMFMPDDAPAKLLHAALKTKYDGAVRHGGGVFANGAAAYCAFDAPPTAKTCARFIAKAKRYGAKRLIVISKLPPDVPDVDGISVKTVVGNEAYTLFASLDALPQKQFSARKKRAFGAFRGALGKDKILRYAMLAAAFLFISWLGRSIVTFSCAVVCAALTVACVVSAAVKAAKAKKDNR